MNSQLNAHEYEVDEDKVAVEVVAKKKVSVGVVAKEMVADEVERKEWCSEELEREWERFMDLSLYEKTFGDGYTWHE